MLTEVQQHNFIMLAANYAIGKDSETMCDYVETLLLSWQSVHQKTRDILISYLEDQVKLHNQMLFDNVKKGNANGKTNLGELYDADVWIKLLNFMKRNRVYGKPL